MRNAQGDGSYFKDGGYFVWKLRGDGPPIVRKAKTMNALRVKVKAVREQLQTSGGRGIVRISRQAKLCDFLAYWLDYIVVTKAAKTKRFYEQQVRLYINPNIGQVRLSELNSTHIRQMMRELSDRKRKDGRPALSPRTQQHALTVLRTALNAGMSETPPLIAVDPTSGVEGPKQAPRKVGVMKPTSVPLYLAALDANTRYNWALKLFLVTGVRVSEGLACTWDDVITDSNPPVLRINKQLGDDGEFMPVKRPKSNRLIPLGKVALDALANLKALSASSEGADLIICTSTGKSPGQRNLLRALQTSIEAAGLPMLTLHDLRRSYGTFLARQKAPLHVCRDLMGHSSASTTAQYYLIVVEEDAKDAANAIDKAVLGSNRSIQNAKLRNGVSKGTNRLGG